MSIRHLIRSFASTLPIQAFFTTAMLTVSASAQTPLQFEELPRNAMPVALDPTLSVALGDVDGDGDLDMAIGNDGQQNRLYLNDGTGDFTDETASRMPVYTDRSYSVVLGDVDGDGDLDMVIGNWELIGLQGHQNRLYLNDGTGTFTDATASQMPVDTDRTWSVALGDVDGDGDLDMVTGNDFQQNRLYLNNGAGTFTDATAGRMPWDASRSSSVVLGDIDGDGDLDMVIGNFGAWNGGQQNRLYLNDGMGTFTDATASQMPVETDWTLSVALGDVDGDGDLDAVIGNGGQNRLYLNNGTGSFTDATASRMPVDNDGTWSVALGDVDGDGDLDMVQGNPQQNRLYLNDGAGTFADATALRMPVDSDPTGPVALVDVDVDGDLDLVIGNYGQQHRLYRNLQRQLHAPTAPQLGQSYSLDAYLRYGPASTVDIAAVFLSTAPASIALPPFGTLGIDLAQAAPFPTLIISQPAGVGSVGFTVPNQPALVGLAIYSQALLVAYPNDLRLSNVVRDVIQ